MLLGLGTDLCAQARITRLYQKFGTRFLTRVFTAAEIRQAEKAGRRSAGSETARHSARHLALAFAAKEAASKALGTGIRRLGTGASPHPVFWHDIESSRAPSGKPLLQFHNVAKTLARARAKSSHSNACACVEVSMSDENGLAHALVALYACQRETLHDAAVVV